MTLLTKERVKVKIGRALKTRKSNFITKATNETEAPLRDRCLNSNIMANHISAIKQPLCRSASSVALFQHHYHYNTPAQQN